MGFNVELQSTQIGQNWKKFRIFAIHAMNPMAQLIVHLVASILILHQGEINTKYHLDNILNRQA